MADVNREKYNACVEYNCECREGSLRDAVKGVDALLCASSPSPGTVTKGMIRSMADNPIVFAAANPEPEIWPWDAKEAGAAVVATGRSDFPNQINNSLGFPGIFRGALDVQARTITDDMCIAAALELAKVAEDRGLKEDYIIPSMDEWEVFPREAAAVGMQAIKEGIARKRYTHEELLGREISSGEDRVEDSFSLLAIKTTGGDGGQWISQPSQRLVVFALHVRRGNL